MDTAMATTEETRKLVDKEGIELGLGMHLESKGLSKSIGQGDQPKYVINRCKLRVSDFKDTFRVETIVNRIMPLVAENVAQAYGVPLWLRGKKPKEYFMEKYGLSDYHYELIDKYISRGRIAEIRNTMEASYNNSSEVKKNPLLHTDIDTLEPIGHNINVPEEVIRSMNSGPSAVLVSTGGL